MPTFIQNTGETIQNSFEEFHKNNPRVYEEVKKMIDKAKARGKKKVSIKMIINVIRWEVYMDTIVLTLFTDFEGKKHKFRINDAFTSRYARLYQQEHPGNEDLFETRRLRSI